MSGACKRGASEGCANRSGALADALVGMIGGSAAPKLVISMIATPASSMNITHATSSSAKG